MTPIRGPAPAFPLGLALAGAAVVAAGLPVTLGTAPPSILAILTVSVQSALLLALRQRDGTRAFGWVGFHVGLFAFFLSYPLFAPSTAAPGVPDEVRDRLDLALLLTVVGFECGYAFAPRARTGRGAIPPVPVTAGNSARSLLALVVLGLAAWLATVLDVSQSAGVSLDTVLFTMRGPLVSTDAIRDTWLPYRSFLLGGGMWVSAAAAGLLITSSSAHVSRAARALCWLVLVAVVLPGFLRGSRAVFLYSVVPLLSVAWLLTGRSRLLGLRLACAAVLAALVGLGWSAMSAMRGGDVRQYEGGWENLDPTQHVEGAFNVYSATAEIVEGFPRQYPYQLGRSLVPLFLGWVPRPIWPGKPYPFSEYANYLRGESLEARGASLAVGLTGEGYGNFGLLGCWLWGGMLGMASVWGGYWLTLLRLPHVLELQLAGFGAVCVAMMVRGGVPEMFYMGVGIVPWPLLLALIQRRRAASKPTRDWRRAAPRRAVA